MTATSAADGRLKQALALKNQHGLSSRCGHHGHVDPETLYAQGEDAYFDGRMDEAERLLRQAAEAGRTDAAVRLGRMHDEVGHKNEAIRWYQAATDHGRLSSPDHEALLLHAPAGTLRHGMAQPLACPRGCVHRGGV